jgi:hypothetical protein
MSSAPTAPTLRSWTVTLAVTITGVLLITLVAMALRATLPLRQAPTRRPSTG